MNHLNIIMWEGTSKGASAADLRVVLVESDGHYTHDCELTWNDRRVCTGPEAEPLIAYAKIEWEVVAEKYAD